MRAAARPMRSGPLRNAAGSVPMVSKRHAPARAPSAGWSGAAAAARVVRLVERAVAGAERAVQAAGVVAEAAAMEEPRCRWPPSARPPAVASAAQAVARVLVGEALAEAARVVEAQEVEATSANAKSIRHTSATTGHRPVVSSRDAFNKANDFRDERGRNEK